MKMQIKFFLMLLVIVILAGVFFDVKSSKAAATEWNFLEIVLDTDFGGAYGDSYFEQFHGFYFVKSPTHTDSGGTSWYNKWEEILNLPSSPTPEPGFNCGIWIIEDDSPSDKTGILWAKKKTKLSVWGSSLLSDLGTINVNWKWCDCDKSSTAGDCTINKSGAALLSCSVAGANKVVEFSYGNMDETMSGGSYDSTLAVGGTNNRYKPDHDILCVDTNKWSVCDDENACALVDTTSYSCSDIGVWAECTGTCTGGTCDDAEVTCFTDGTKTIDEQCDGTDFGIATCVGFGFDSGDLICDDCVIDTSDCVGEPTCISTGPEICGDGIDNDCLNGQDCEDPVCESTDCDSGDVCQVGKCIIDDLGIGVCAPVLNICGGLVPCGREADNPATTWDDSEPCEVCHGALLLNQGTDFLLQLASIVAILGFVVVGFLFVISSGNPEMKTLAKNSLKWIIIGYLILFLSWIFVDFILSAWGFLDPMGGEWSVICD